MTFNSTVWVAGATAALVLLQACSGAGEAQTLAKAEQLFAKREFAAAEATLKTALQAAPSSAALRFNLGKALFEQGQYVGALVELNKALELKHDSAVVLPYLVNALVFTGQAKAALDRYGKTVLPQPQAQARLLMALGNAHGSLGDMTAGRAAIAAAYEADPKNPDATIVKAREMLAKGLKDEAKAATDAVLAAHPDNVSAWYLRGLLFRYVDGKRDEALKAQRRALEIQPRSTLAHAEALSILFEGGDRKALREQLNKMEAALPKHPDTFLYRAQLLYLDNNLSDARSLLQELTKLRSRDVRVLLLAAKVELRIGSIATAERYLNDALQLAPQLTTARLLLAGALLRQGQGDRALAALQPLIERDPPDPNALAAAAEATLYKGDFAKAQQLLRRAAQADPNNQRLRAALALAAISRGDTSSGMAELESVAAKSESDNFAALALLAEHVKRGDTAAALRTVATLAERMPQQALPHYLRGQILMSATRFVEAREPLEAALKAEPAYYPALASLLVIDEIENKPELARSRVEAFLKNQPQHVQATLDLARMQLLARQPQEGIVALLQGTIQKHPLEAAPRVSLAALYLHTGDPKRAIGVAQDGLALLPDHADLLDILGQAQLRTRSYQQAMATFRRLQVSQPQSPMPHLRQAEVLLSQGERAGARQAVRRALQVEPGNVASELRLAELALAEKDYAEAAVVAQRLSSTHPTDPRGPSLEGTVALRAGKPAVALEHYRKALARAPLAQAAVGQHLALVALGQAGEAASFAARWQKDQPRDLTFILHLGNQAVKARDWAAAETHFRAALGLDAGLPLANNNLAWALLQQNKPGAMPFALAAQKATPESPEIGNTLANAYLADGQFTRAIGLAEAILAKNRDFHAARLTLARAALANKDVARARRELEALAWQGVKFSDHAAVAALMAQLPR
jgi:cellulose synthase operon protein C